MKKTLQFIFCFLVYTTHAQTTLYTETFETGGASISLNTSDMGGINTSNTWVLNNSYSGGSGSLTCIGSNFGFTIPSTNNQASGITNSPNSTYLHIASQEAITDGINCSSFQASDGFCYFAESNFAKMNTDINTSNMTGVTLDLWWMCEGESTTYGKIYYSIDGGTNWLTVTNNLNYTSNWTNSNYTMIEWENQATLRFAYRFVNNSSSGLEPGFCIDDIKITAIPNCTNTDTSYTVSSCESFESPSGKTWTSSNIYFDTIPNSGACDSLITIDLIINTATSNSFSQTVCGSLLWIDNVTYYNDTTTTHTLVGGNINGCDSIVTIHLTVENKKTGIDMQTSCGAFVWLDNHSYLQDNNTATHTIIGGASNGCDSVISLDLTIIPISDSVSISNFTLTAEQENAEYQWLDCANNYSEIESETNQEYTTTTTGEYAVQVIKNGCVDTSKCFSIIVEGIENQTIFKDVRIFPNPTSGMLYFELATLKNVSIEIFDLKGNTVFSDKKINNNRYQIETNISTGIYIVEIKSIEATKQYKLVIR